MLKRIWRVPARHRHPAQDVVEYGLIVAVIAIVSIVGFNALSGAERAYFGGVQPGLAPTAPAFAVFTTSTPTPVPTNTPGPMPTSTPSPTSTSVPPAFTLSIGTANKELDLTWTVPSGSVSYYNVYRTAAGGAKGTETYLARSNTTSYRDTGLPKNQTYYYYVTAVMVSGPALQSNELGGST